MCLPSMHFVKRQVYFYMRKRQRSCKCTNKNGAHERWQWFYWTQVDKMHRCFCWSTGKIYNPNNVSTVKTRQYGIWICNLPSITQWRWKLAFTLDCFSTCTLFRYKQLHSVIQDYWMKKTHTKIKRWKRSKIARQK